MNRSGYLQKPDAEDSHNPDFASHVHLQFPDEWQREQEDIEITDNVEDPTDIRRDVPRATFAGQSWLICLLDRYALPNRLEKDSDVEQNDDSHAPSCKILHYPVREEHALKEEQEANLEHGDGRYVEELSHEYNLAFVSGIETKRNRERGANL